MMKSKDKDYKSIKKIVARRARELGDRISHREVTLEFIQDEVASGCRIFRTWWGAGEEQSWLAGLIRDEEAPDTYPGQALGKVFHRWLETGVKLPDPGHVAAVSAFFLNASGQCQVILTDEDRDALIQQPEWRPHIRLPEEIETAGQPGVKFWWVCPDGASQMSVYLDSKDRIQTEEVFIQDFLEEV